MLKKFNKLPKQPKYFNIYNSYHSLFTWPPFLFFQHYQQYDTLLPIIPCTHNLKAGIAYCTWVPWINGAGRILTLNTLFYLVHEERDIMP
jgi:hypothetical protein